METTGFIPASSSAQLVDSIAEIHDQLLTARYMAIAGFTLLVYDWLTTLDKEIKFIWRKKWTFARVVYHLNRLLPLLLFGVVLIPILFYSYGVVVLLATSCATSIIRCWALYGQRQVSFTALSLSSVLSRDAYLNIDGLLIPALFLTVGHALAQVTLHIGKSLYLANPFPGILEGCLVLLPSGIWLAYLSGVVYESLVFGLLVWRIWRLSSGVGLTPLVTQLLKHGASFFAVNFGLMLISCVGSGYSRTIIIVNVSGVLTALSSVMCSRIFFSMYEFSNPIRGQISVGPIATGPSEISACGQFGFAMETLRDQNPPMASRISFAVPTSKNPNSNSLTEKACPRKSNNSYV
ncbi:hypothetical protein OPQ81_010997 [Rhizoctonia solani]|nr:hypothetical protein OPQ81_010997 [Rhizoctonia solani]